MSTVQNIFISLHKYRLCEEDFFTEAFSYILKLEGNKIARFLLDKLKIPEGHVEDIVTQYRLPNDKRPDMVIKGNDFIIFFEHKLESGPSGSLDKDGEYIDQTQFYKNYIEGPECESYKERKLFRIVKYFQILGKEDKLIYWSDVYRWMDEIKKEETLSPQLGQYINMFLQLMEVLHMNPVIFIEKDVEIVKRYRDIGNEVRRILDETENMICNTYGFKNAGKGCGAGEEDGWCYCQSRRLKTDKASLVFYLWFGGSSEDGFLIPAINFFESEMQSEVVKYLKDKCGFESSKGWEGIYKELKLPKDFLILSSQEQREKIKQTFDFFIKGIKDYVV